MQNQPDSNVIRATHEQGVSIVPSPLPSSTVPSTHTPVRSNNSDMSGASSLSGAQTLRIDGQKDGSEWRAREGDRETLQDLTVKFHGLETQLQAVQVRLFAYPDVDHVCVCAASVTDVARLHLL